MHSVSVEALAVLPQRNTEFHVEFITIYVTFSSHTDE